MMIEENAKEWILRELQFVWSLWILYSIKL